MNTSMLDQCVSRLLKIVNRSVLTDCNLGKMFNMYSLFNHITRLAPVGLVLLSVLLATQVAAESTLDNDSVILPKGWRSGYAVEPVFNSRVYWVEAGRSHSETVVLIHGLGQNGWRDWQELMPALAEHYRVVAFDLPGFGRSDTPAGKYSPSNYAAAIQAILQQAGIDRFHLMGHSMGGAVALRLATRYPNSVKRLVLMSAAGILERSTFAGHAAALPLEAGMLSYFDALPKSLQSGISGVVRDIGGDLLRWDALPDPAALLNKSDVVWAATLRGQPNINAALALVEEDYSGDLTALDVSTLILWGEEDPVTPLRTGYLLQGQIPNARLVLYPGVGHMPLWHPSKVLPDIKQFLTDKTKVTNNTEELGQNQGDYRCEGKNDVQLRGQFGAIEIINCQNVRLLDVNADSLKLIDSSAVGRGLKLSADEWALSVDRSELTLTNAWLEGKVALQANASQLDLAGVHLTGDEAIRVSRQSEFVFSVSQLQTPGYRQDLHGVFTLGEPAQ
ncbi:alpha/beta hydrolase [Gilvimarinus sp. SDUM040013]|uniref:Alpha/beta hydrolase n=1 Tax=Gilvimarinus gilvus TaxID=3058038 RepID=A0ABU4S2B9_9GAMM|nr:alpha/beta hydrolase [Gilvimarinus sp. SDUM040013]MDO3385872.1 alpha/beta hydrolase [Gilvimarinus sp. SDUM040013]MDX6851165.1 alpha/beta hydrolase [Gilvimarinus sp. SDUM040013]